MPRTARIVIPDIPYNVTSRGNRQQDVFFTIDDRTSYLNWLISYATHYDFNILAYCLMSNHVHIVAIPKITTSMAKRSTSRNSGIRSW
jgi:putative transposase